MRTKVILTYKSKLSPNDKPLNVTCWNATDPMAERHYLIDMGMEINHIFIKATIEKYDLIPIFNIMNLRKKIRNHSNLVGLILLITAIIQIANIFYCGCGRWALLNILISVSCFLFHVVSGYFFYSELYFLIRGNLIKEILVDGLKEEDKVFDNKNTPPSITWSDDSPENYL